MSRGGGNRRNHSRRRPGRLRPPGLAVRDYVDYSVDGCLGFFAEFGVGSSHCGAANPHGRRYGEGGNRGVTTFPPPDGVQVHRHPGHKCGKFGRRSHRRSGREGSQFQQRELQVLDVFSFCFCFEKQLIDDLSVVKLVYGAHVGTPFFAFS